MPRRAARLTKHRTQDQFYRLTDGKQLQSIFAREEFNQAILIGAHLRRSHVDWPCRAEATDINISV